MGHRPAGYNCGMFLLWLLALVIGIYGVVEVLRGEVIFGILLIVLAFLIGPGGYSIFTH